MSTRKALDQALEQEVTNKTPVLGRAFAEEYYVRNLGSQTSLVDKIPTSQEVIVLVKRH